MASKIKNIDSYVPENSYDESIDYVEEDDDDNVKKKHNRRKINKKHNKYCKRDLELKEELKDVINFINSGKKIMHTLLIIFFTSIFILSIVFVWNKYNNKKNEIYNEDEKDKNKKKKDHKNNKNNDEKINIGVRGYSKRSRNRWFTMDDNI